MTRHIEGMDPSWPRWGKILYVVAVLALFAAMMWAAGHWVIYPAQERLRPFLEQWPPMALWGMTVAIPAVLFTGAYFAYRRDHRRGMIASPSFWQYFRTGR